MGKFGLSNPTVDFVIEVIKTLEQDELEQVARAVTERLSNRQIIDISNAKSSYANSQGDPSIDANSLNATLQNLLNHGSVQSLLNNGSVQSLLSNEKNLAKVLSLLKGKPPAPEPKPDREEVPAIPNKGSSLTDFMKIAAQFMNTSNGTAQTPHEALFEAIIPFIAPHRQEQVQSLQPVIKMFSTFQTLTGKKFSLSKIINMFKLQTE